MRCLEPLSLLTAFALLPTSALATDDAPAPSEETAGTTSADTKPDEAAPESTASPGEGRTDSTATASAGASTAAGASRPLLLGALIGYGFGDYWGLGLGARGGVLTLDDQIYLGAVGEYFFGNSTSTSSSLGGRYEVTGRRIVGGGEAGFEAKLDAVHIRPYLGLGLSVRPQDICDRGVCHGDTTIAGTLGPGATVTWHHGALFAGGDFRYVVVLGSASDSAPLLQATAGLTL